MKTLPDNDDFAKAVQSAREAMTRPLTPEDMEAFAYHPTLQDWAEYEAWDRSVQEHDDALDLWLGFFGDDEKSTFFIS